MNLESPGSSRERNEGVRMDITLAWWSLVAAIAVPILGLAYWIGVLQGRVTSLENEPDCVDAEACRERMSALKELSEIRFQSGDEQFQEIKAMILRNDQLSQARHKEVMDYLLMRGKQ